MFPRTRALRWLLISSLLGYGVLSAAGDWPQWRGPLRDGIVREASLPAKWPRELTKAWQVAVGSGYSSPVTAGDAVFVFSRQGDAEVVSRLDRATGQTVWKQSYPAAFRKNQYAREMAPGPFSTPLVSGGHVFTFGVTAILTAWDAKAGKVLWRKNWSAKQDTSKLFTGTAMSPLLDSGLLIIHQGDDRGGTLIALDPATGAQRWATPTVEGPGYASPVILETSGVRQFVTLTDRSLIGVAVKDGRLLWSVPYRDEWNENIVTPVVDQDRVIVSGVRKPAAAFRLTNQGGRWTAQTIWTNPAAPMYMSSPVLDGGYLYGLSSRNKGQWTCLDARTGKTMWATQGREGNAGSVTLAGEVLLLLNESGSLVVARKSPAGFEQISRYALGEGTYASPAVVSGGLIVKDANTVAFWKW
jgi:outer membrane protein assembly factor BamB